MCWLAVEASHSNGLSHLQGRQAHSLTLCVLLYSLPASQTAAAMGGTQKEKKKKREPHSNSARAEENESYAAPLFLSPHCLKSAAFRSH